MACLDRIGGIDRDLVVGLVAARDPEVVVLQVNAEIGLDQLGLDKALVPWRADLRRRTIKAGRRRGKQTGTLSASAQGTNAQQVIDRAALARRWVTNLSRLQMVGSDLLGVYRIAGHRESHCVVFQMFTNYLPIY
jgi:hypothetical protein